MVKKRKVIKPKKKLSKAHLMIIHHLKNNYKNNKLKKESIINLDHKLRKLRMKNLKMKDLRKMIIKEINEFIIYLFYILIYIS